MRRFPLVFLIAVPEPLGQQLSQASKCSRYSPFPLYASSSMSVGSIEVFHFSPTTHIWKAFAYPPPKAGLQNPRAKFIFNFLVLGTEDTCLESPELILEPLESWRL